MVRYEDIKLSPSDAFDIFMEKYPKANIKKVELDTKSSSYVYKVKGEDEANKYKLYISPVDGSIVKLKEELNREGNKYLNKDKTQNVNKLVEKAINDAGEGSRIDEWSIEMDKGILVLEVEIELKNGKEIEYKYNLETGDLIKRRN